MAVPLSDPPGAVRLFGASLREALKGRDSSDAALDALLWDALRAMAGSPFSTMKGLAFTYRIQGNEMFVDRKEKSLTRATVLLAFYNALAILSRGEEIRGPKALKTFGASYLFPVFQALGVIPKVKEKT